MPFLAGLNAVNKYKHMKIVKRLELSTTKIQLNVIIRPENFKLAIIIKRTIINSQNEDLTHLLTYLQ